MGSVGLNQSSLCLGGKMELVEIVAMHCERSSDIQGLLSYLSQASASNVLVSQQCAVLAGLLRSTASGLWVWGLSSATCAEQHRAASAGASLLSGDGGLAGGSHRAGDLLYCTTPGFLCVGLSSLYMFFCMMHLICSCSPCPSSKCFD